MRSNQRDGDWNRVREAVQTHYHRGWRAKENQRPEEYEKDLVDHVQGRLQHDRAVIVPWLHSVLPLRSARILEIGCGTGSSSVALAEQGARVVGIDIDEDALTVARARCEAHGVNCEFLAVNVAEYSLERPFDIIIFFACLEHMTVDERLTALKNLWDQMRDGAYMAVIETPNRLWHRDAHTSRLPFFHWLPDELAFRYLAKSPRFEGYGRRGGEDMLHFLRLGRGVSFHEFELACGRLPPVVSSLLTAMPLQVIGRPEDWIYKALIRREYRGLHPGWFEESLDLVVRK